MCSVLKVHSVTYFLGACQVTVSHSPVSQTKLHSLDSCKAQNKVPVEGIYNWTEGIRKLQA